jgi:hypothetical protein
MSFSPLFCLKVGAKMLQGAPHAATQADEVLPVFDGAAAIARRPQTKVLQTFKNLRIQPRRGHIAVEAQAVFEGSQSFKGV